MGCTDKVATGFRVGSHASTFGGNPLCSAAAFATLTTLLDEELPHQAADTGAYFLEHLKLLKSKHRAVVDVRGLGLMIGVELAKPVAGVLDRMLQSGIICGPAGPNVLRFVPPLIVTREQIDRVVDALDSALREA